MRMSLRGPSAREQLCDATSVATAASYMGARVQSGVQEVPEGSMLLLDS